jgi:hypothetical protein
VRITGAVFAAGVATVTCDSTAHMEAGDQGPRSSSAFSGARELNGLRTIASVLDGVTFTVALAAMGAYTGGGVAILNEPYPFAPKPVTGCVSAGGAFPTPFSTSRSPWAAITASKWATGDPGLRHRRLPSRRTTCSPSRPLLRPR